MEPEPRRKKAKVCDPDQEEANEEPSSSSRPGAGAVPAPAMDFCPLVLGAEAQAEWDSALAAAASVAAEVENAPQAAVQPAVKTATTAKTSFHAKMGLQDLGRVKRAGVACYHYGMPVAKGEFRFTLCFNTKKPGRGIHTDCLSQLPEASVENSIEFLRAKLQEALPAAEHAICQGALETLTASTAASSRS